QDHRGSIMVDLSHLELFHGVGRGGHRHDDWPVIAGVMDVNVLQQLYKIRQHSGHPGTPLVSSLRRRLWTESISPARKNLSAVGDQIKRHYWCQFFFRALLVSVLFSAKKELTPIIMLLALSLVAHSTLLARSWQAESRFA